MFFYMAAISLEEEFLTVLQVWVAGMAVASEDAVDGGRLLVPIVDCGGIPVR